MLDPAWPRIVVEGSDDKHVVAQLLIAHGIVAHADGPANNAPQNTQVVVEAAGSKDNLLAQIAVRLNSPTTSVGFVVDADDPSANQAWSFQKTWDSVRDRFTRQRLKVDPFLPSGGLVVAVRELVDHQDQPILTGVWIMPDNASDGTVEDFLTSLVHASDPLLPHAEASTDAAKELAEKLRTDHFLDKDRKKAILSTWLAWDNPPGLPYGTAIKRRRFQHDTELAQRFVAWVRQLIGIGSA